MRIGIDFGGTKIEGIALDEAGQVLVRQRVPTPRDDYAGTVAAIAALVGDIESATGRRGTVGVGIPGALSRLDAAGIDWEIAVDSDNDRTIEATVSADLAIHATMEGNLPAQTEEIDHGGSLPDPGRTGIVMYVQKTAAAPVQGVAEMLRAAFSAA